MPRTCARGRLYKPVEHRNTSDVIVIGGGAWGLASAWGCVGRGLSVRLFERAHIAAGASGGVVGALAPHVPENWNAKKQFQFESLAQGDAYWRAIETVGERSTGYARIGRLIPLSKETAHARALTRQHGAHTHWGNDFSWQVQPAPSFLKSDAAPFGVVHETLSARIDPRAACLALAAALTRKGGVIHENTPVTRIEDGIVDTGGAPFYADAIIVTHGVAGLNWLGAQTGLKCGSAVKGQAAVLNIDLGFVPQIHADGLYIVPRADRRLAIGSTSEKTWRHEGTDAALDLLVARAARLVPVIADAPVHLRWAGFRPRAPLPDPMIGPIPGYARVFAALGAFKIGFGLMPGVGTLIADLVTETRGREYENFSVTRHLQRAARV